MEKWLIWIFVLSSIFLPWIQLISGSLRKRHVNYKHGIHKFDVTCKENKANQDHESDFYAFLKLSDATVSLAYNLIIFAIVASMVCWSFLHLKFGRQLLKKIVNTLNTYALTSPKKSKDFVHSFVQSFPCDLDVYGLESLFGHVLSEFRPSPDLPLMRYEWKRYESYKTYPSDGPSSPLKLAENGFYYTKQGSKVKCFSCNITNDLWPDHESVAETHQRISPGCRFGNLNVPIHEQNDNLTAMFPDFGDEDKRLNSLNILRDVSINKPHFAAAGFFLKGETNEVRCYFCGSRVKHLRANDNPWYYHLHTCKHFETGVLSGAVFKKPPITAGVQEMIRVSDSHFAVLRRATLRTFPLRLPYSGISYADFVSGTYDGWCENSPLYDTVPALRRRENVTLRDRNVHPHLNNRLEHPEYKEFQERRTSFQTFPHSNGIQALKMALAGFFYTGEEDSCQCFRCGGCLENWTEGDDPYKRHLQSFPNCDFINEIKDRYIFPDLQVSTQSDNNVCDRGLPGLLSLSTQETVPENIDFINCTAAQGLIYVGYPAALVKEAFEVLQPINGNAPVTVEDIMCFMQDREPNLVNAGNTENILPKTTMDLLHHNQETLETPSSRSHSRCKVCFDNEASIVFLPCGHLAVCPTCNTAGAFRKCVICRAIIQGTVRAYIA